MGHAEGNGIEIRTDKCGFILAGGGSYGSFQAGVLDYLINQANADYKGIYGISIGAVNAANLAGAGPGQDGLSKQCDQLLYMWEHMTDIFHHLPFLPPKDFIDAYSVNFCHLLTQSLFKASSLQKYITEIFTDELLANLYALHRYFAVGTVSEVDGRMHMFRNEVAVRNVEMRRQLVDYVVGSMSMPAFFPPSMITIDDCQHKCFDGGLREPCPVQTAYEDDRYEWLVVINCNADRIKLDFTSSRLTQYLARAMDIFHSSLIVGDVRTAVAVSSVLKAADLDEITIDIGGRTQTFGRTNILYIEPENENNLLFDSLLDFAPKKIQSAMDYGRLCAGNVIRKLGVTFVPPTDS